MGKHVHGAEYVHTFGFKEIGVTISMLIWHIVEQYMVIFVSTCIPFRRLSSPSSIVQAYLHKLVPNVLHKHDFSESFLAVEVLPRDIPPEATYLFIV